jgi:hypothetical protein
MGELSFSLSGTSNYERRKEANMKTIIAVIVLALALPAYGADWGRGGGARRGEEDARRVCMEQARATGHNVTGVGAINRNGRDDYRVMLQVPGMRQALMCHYDQRSGGAELQWSNVASPGYGTDWGRWGGARRGEEDARRVCMEQARATGHNVTGVRSITRNGRDDYRLTLAVEGVRQPLYCHYDERSGGAELQWSYAGR